MIPRKIWVFGLPSDSMANVLFDGTKFKICTKLENYHAQHFKKQHYLEYLEPIRGVRFNIEDVKLHQDSAHRGVSQVAPATKRALFAAQMQSSPVLLEPLYRCDITAPRSALPGVYATLRVRRAIIADAEEQDEMAERFGIIPIRAFLPVSESFGFTELLRKNTSGQAFPQTIFSHWQPVKGDLLDPASPAHAIATAIRQRKGLNPTLPLFSDYNSNDIAPPSKASSSSSSAPPKS